MVSFKFTVLLAAATAFLGANAYAIPRSNLSPGPEGHSPRAFPDNMDHTGVNTGDTESFPSTSPSTFAKHVVEVDRLTGNFLDKNPRIKAAKKKLNNWSKDLAHITSEGNSSNKVPLDDATNIGGIDDEQSGMM